MNTSTEAVRLLQESLAAARQAQQVINNLMIEHEYQDVAGAIAAAAVSLLESASSLMQSQDEIALDQLNTAEDFLDVVWDIIDSETEED